MRRVAAALVLGIAACSPVTSQLPSGNVGDEYTQGTRSAFQDVIFDAGLQLGTGPECEVTGDETGLDCTGTTLDGRTAEAHAVGGDNNDLNAARLTVRVGDETIYEGTVSDVLQAADEQGGDG